MYSHDQKFLRITQILIFISFYDANLHQGGLASVRAAKKPPLSRKNIRDRQKFCKRYRDWTAEDGGKVIFTDEFPFVWRHLKKACPGKKGDVSCQQYNILKIQGSGLFIQFCLRTQPQIKNGSKTSSKSNFSQPSKNSLVCMMEHLSIRQK